VAVNVDFGILRPVDVGGQFTNAFRQGAEDRAQSETKSALSALAADPNADVTNLIKYNPQAYQAIQAQRQKAQQQRTVGDALTGNAQARKEVAYFDAPMFLEMEGNAREQAKEGLKAIGQLVEWADTPEKFDAAVRQLGPEGAQYLGRFSEREAILAQTGELMNSMERAEPSIGYVPNDATAFAKNASGENVLRALNGQQPQGQQGQPQGTYATREQIDTIKRSMGGNQNQVDQYIQNQGLSVVDEVQTGPDGKQYFLINGAVYDNPRGQ